MVVSCGEGVWVCVGDSVRVVRYACRVCTCTYCVVCASLYTCMSCVCVCMCLLCRVCVCVLYRVRRVVVSFICEYGSNITPVTPSERAVNVFYLVICCNVYIFISPTYRAAKIFFLLFGSKVATRTLNQTKIYYLCERKEAR